MFKDREWDPVPVTSILRSIEAVFKTKNIDRLTKGAYNFLYLMSGFIAHYNLHGFRSNYSDLRELVNDILRSPDSRDPERMIRDKWFVSTYGERYCQSKVDAFKGITALAERYQAEVDIAYALDQSSREVAKATILAEKNGYILVKKEEP